MPFVYMESNIQPHILRCIELENSNGRLPNNPDTQMRRSQACTHYRHS